MKKLLLSASVLMMAASSFAAVITDGKTYEPVGDMTCENLWIIDRVHGGFTETPLAENNSSRTATTDGKVIYVGKSTEGAVHKWDVATGEYLGKVQMTLNGEAYVTTLGLNQVGFDEYGHFYCATFATNTNGDGTYQVFLGNLETGELTSVGDLNFFGGTGRIDYCDVVGDLTGVEAGCTVMAATSGSNKIFNWHLEKGTTEWVAGWDDGLVYREITETYPADQLDFKTGPIVKIIRDGSATGDANLFYFDGNTTTPSLYGTDGAMSDSFANVDFTETDGKGNITHQGKTEIPDVATNGVAEANIGQNLIIYSLGQYNAGYKCKAVVTAVDDELSFASMQKLWTIPEDGLGEVSDIGTRVHCLDRILLPEENGVQSMLLVTFKCYNGFGVYKISNKGNGGVAENVVADATIAVKGNVIAVSEVAESIEVFNVAGQKVAAVENAAEIAAPVNGAYIVKAVVNGNVVTKKVIL